MNYSSFSVVNEAGTPELSHSQVYKVSFLGTGSLKLYEAFYVSVQGFLSLLFSFLVIPNS